MHRDTDLSVLRLNLGAGATPLPGWENLDRKTGEDIFPLGYPDNVADEIRASHVLEHFPHGQIGAVLAEWVRVLKPGGVLKVAVPDFELVARLYLEGQPIPVQGYVMGGQVDGDDYHKAIFDREELANALRAAGLVGVTDWVSEQQDCAALPISLNLQGRKRVDVNWRVGGAMSVPRLGFMDNFFCAFQALHPLGIGLRKHTGAFWGQCIERSCEEWLAEGVDWVLTIDYDTVFTRRDVETLLSLAAAHPEADAIAALQASRARPFPLMTIRGEDGKNVGEVTRDTFFPDLTRCSTAHFGLTLIKADKLRALKKPWFWSQPDAAGKWTDARTDDDIYFWRQWEKAGNTLYLANHVPVGHMELMIRWPGQDFRAIHQRADDFWSEGLPEGAWR